MRKADNRRTGWPNPRWANPRFDRRSTGRRRMRPELRAPRSAPQLRPRPGGRYPCFFSQPRAPCCQ